MALKMTSLIKTEADRGIVRLTLDRPAKRNALRRETIEALLQAVQQAAEDPFARALVLGATGDVFCSGMDLDQMQERAGLASAEAEYDRDSRVYADLLISMLNVPFPVIAAVQGPVLAGGMGLVCACDLVIAVESAWFMLPEPLRGITAAMVTPLLMHRIGPGPATSLLLACEKVSAIEGRRLGLCHDVVPQEELENRVGKLVQGILGASRSALAATKQHVFDCLARDVGELVRQSIDASARARGTADAREGLAAFLEKRKPRWQP
jgi:methylglutaconyl-CoA hydratase